MGCTSNSLHSGYRNFACFLGVMFASADYFFLLTYSNKSFRNNIKELNSVDPAQTRCFVGPDLGLNCLQRLSADN